MVEPDYELVRVSRQLIDELLKYESPPVVVVGLERQEDGTCDLILRRPELAVEIARYRQALESIAAQALATTESVRCGGASAPAPLAAATE